MKDYHVHSNFSDDCNQHPLIHACENAIKTDVEEIAFTEHVDIDYPNDKGDFQLDYQSYSQEIEKARSLFPNLVILKGLELGMQADIAHKMEEYLSRHSFDFILGSIHTADGLELHSGDFTARKDQLSAIKRYFEVMYECVSAFDNFHILAHFDLIRRYGNYSSMIASYSPFYDLIDEIYKIIIAKGIGLEINTSGWRYGVNTFLPGKELLKRYRNLGGEIITFGSDAHRPEHLSYRFKEAYEMAKDVGFKYYSYYRLGKPRFTAIP